MLAYIPLPKTDTAIYDYLEENIEHTMFLSPVDDLELFKIIKIKDQLISVTLA